MKAQLRGTTSLSGDDLIRSMMSSGREGTDCFVRGRLRERRCAGVGKGRCRRICCPACVGTVKQLERLPGWKSVIEQDFFNTSGNPDFVAGLQVPVTWKEPRSDIV